MKFATTLNFLDREIVYRYGDMYDENNRYLRVAYMLNELDEPYFKKELQRRDKQRERYRDINNIYRMVIDTGGDLLRQYVLEPEKYGEIMDICKKLIEYANSVLITIRKRFNCIHPMNIYLH
jgi:hypothetical protein